MALKMAFLTIEERTELWSISEDPAGTGGSSFETAELGVLAASDWGEGRRVGYVRPDAADLTLSLRLPSELARELASLDNFDCDFAGTAGAWTGGLLDFDWKSGISGITSIAGRDSIDCLGVPELLCCDKDGGPDGGGSYLDNR